MSAPAGTGRRVLVTGAQGFVGRYLVAHWLSAEPDAAVVGVGRSLANGSAFNHVLGPGPEQVPAPLPAELRTALDSPRYGYEVLDLCAAEEVAGLLRRFRPDVVIHLAAALRDEPLDRLLRSNVAATAGLMECIASAGVPARVVIGSTGAVYGSAAALPLSEGSPREPDDLYAVTKHAGEQVARLLARRSGIPIMFARIFNVMGPGQDERHVCGWLCGQLAAAPEDEDVVVEVGPLDTTRDFVDVRDVARALRIVATEGAAGAAYNVASGVETGVGEAFRVLLERSGRAASVRVRRRERRPHDVARHCADIASLRRLGYEPAVSLAESLDDMVRYYESDVAAARLAAR